jgi:hypothetical protein
VEGISCAAIEQKLIQHWRGKNATKGEIRKGTVSEAKYQGIAGGFENIIFRE